MPDNKSKLFEEIASLEKAHDAFSQMMNRTNDKIINERGRGSLDYYDIMVDSDATLAGLIETRVDAVAGLD